MPEKFKLVTVHAVYRVPERFDVTEDLPDLLPDAGGGRVQFATGADYTPGDLEDAGADPSSWLPLEAPTAAEMVEEVVYGGVTIVDGVKVPNRWAMYSDEGNAAVRQAALDVLAAVRSDDKIRNRKTLAAVARPIFRAVGSTHPEVSDTEPRQQFGDFLDGICEAHGWAYDPWMSYDLQEDTT